MDGTDLNNIRTVNYNINFDASLLHLLLLHLLHDGHSQLLHLDHGEVGKGKNVFLSSGHNLLPVGLGTLHESLEAKNRNGNEQQRLNALDEHLECFADEEPLELVTHGLITDSWQISPVLWWRRRIHLLNLYDIFHFRLILRLLLKAPNASSATLAESVPRDADDGHQNEDIGADTHHCREPGVAVHEVPQTSQVGLNVKRGARDFDQLGLHLDMELAHWSMRIRVKVAKKVTGTLCFCSAQPTIRPGANATVSMLRSKGERYWEMEDLQDLPMAAPSCPVTFMQAINMPSPSLSGESGTSNTILILYTWPWSICCLLPRATVAAGKVHRVEVWPSQGSNSRFTGMLTNSTGIYA